MEKNPEMFAALNYIKNKVEALEKIELHRMRNDKEMKKEYQNLLLSDHDLLAVYKAIDGKRSQKEIAVEAGVTEMQVTRKTRILAEQGLIEILEIKTDTSKVYIHTVAEAAFKLSRLKDAKQP